MSAHVVEVSCMLATGKTRAWLSHLHGTIDKLKRHKIFVSHSLETVVDGQRRLRTLLDVLEAEPDPAKEDPVAASGGTWIKVTDLADLTPSLDLVLRTRRAELRELVVSALRQIARAIGLILSTADRPGHAKTEFLMERHWFLFNGEHPPRTLRTAVTKSFPWVCSASVSAT